MKMVETPGRKVKRNLKRRTGIVITARGGRAKCRREGGVHGIKGICKVNQRKGI